MNRFPKYFSKKNGNFIVPTGFPQWLFRSMNCSLPHCRWPPDLLALLPRSMVPSQRLGDAVDVVTVKMNVIYQCLHNKTNYLETDHVDMIMDVMWNSLETLQRPKIPNFLPFKQLSPSPGAAVSFGRPGEAVPSTGTTVRAASCSASAAARAEAASTVTTADAAGATATATGTSESDPESAESEPEESSTSSARGGGIRCSDPLFDGPQKKRGPAGEVKNGCRKKVLLGWWRLWSCIGCYAMSAKCSWPIIVRNKVDFKASNMIQQYLILTIGIHWCTKIILAFPQNDAFNISGDICPFTSALIWKLNSTIPFGIVCMWGCCIKGEVVFI